jgi:hypothetical protein
MNRAIIIAELAKLEAMLQDEQLDANYRIALLGAQQALRHIVEPRVWQRASQTFYRIDNRPIESSLKDKSVNSLLGGKVIA